jgi:hypothetical protein
MNYKIILEDRSQKLGIPYYWRISKNGNPLEYEDLTDIFLSRKSVSYIPVLLNNYCKEVNCYANEEAILFGEAFNDLGELIVPKFMVGFSLFIYITLLNIKDFYILCLDFAEKAIAAVRMFGLKEKEIVNDEWIESIKKLIPKIKEKIFEYSSCF